MFGIEGAARVFTTGRREPANVVGVLMTSVGASSVWEVVEVERSIGRVGGVMSMTCVSGVTIGSVDLAGEDERVGERMVTMGEEGAGTAEEEDKETTTGDERLLISLGAGVTEREDEVEMEDIGVITSIPKAGAKKWRIPGKVIFFSSYSACSLTSPGSKSHFAIRRSWNVTDHVKR